MSFKAFYEEQRKQKKSNDTSQKRSTKKQDETDWGFRQAAAVVTTFQPDKLDPFSLDPQLSDAHREIAISRLLTDCQQISIVESSRWSLNHGTRKAALKRLKSKDRIEAALFSQKDRPTDVQQTLFESFIGGIDLEIESRPLVELRQILEILDWISETELANQVVKDDVKRLMAFQGLMEPFRYLVGDHFRGREKELAELKSYVWDNAKVKKPPKLIFGPGGVGKSTLLSKFILQHTEELPPGRRIPFVYIDFDRNVMTPEIPLTLLFEAAKQLEFQYPEILNGVSQNFEADWLYVLNAINSRSVQGDFESVKQVGEFESDGGDLLTSDHFYDFRKKFFEPILAQLEIPFAPLLIVLDTFENVQVRSQETTESVFSFFDELSYDVPELRLVVGGRGEIDQHKVEVDPMHLGAFDELAAVGYLQFKGVSDASLATEIFNLVGGNPLSLKLAAKVVRIELESEEPASLSEILHSIKDEHIQGQLYRRILNHIEDEEVCNIAHPGLALRVVSADLILKVLAVPCKLRITTMAEAEDLFERLRLNVDLVKLDRRNEKLLWHRADVRGEMLHALQIDMADEVHDIHNRAIAYYAAIENDSAARVEEIYHRLVLAQDVSNLNERWNSAWRADFERSLMPIIAEFEPPMRAWLVSKLGLTGVEDDFTLETADLKSWEAGINNKVENLIFHGDFRDASNALSRKIERSIGSPLYYWETYLHMQRHNWAAARASVGKGLWSMNQADNEVERLKLLKQAVRIEVQLKNFEQALRNIASSEKLSHLDDHWIVTELEFGMYRLEIKREKPTLIKADIAELRADLLQLFNQIPDEILQGNARIVRKMVTEFGNEDVAVLSKGLTILTLGSLSAERRRELGKSLARLDHNFSTQQGEADGVLFALTGKVPEGDRIDEIWMSFTESSADREINGVITKILDDYGDQLLSPTEDENSSDDITGEIHVGLDDIIGKGSLNIGNIVTGDVVQGDGYSAGRIGDPSESTGYDLDRSDYKSLVDIVTQLPSWQSVTSRREQLSEALSGSERRNDILGSLDLAGSAQQAAIRTITGLTRFGQLSNGETALGHLLNSLVDQVRPEEREFIGMLFEKYNLGQQVIVSEPKQASLDVEPFELLIQNRTNYFDVSYLQIAWDISSAVVRVVLKNGRGVLSSGFVCGENLLMIGSHVLATPQDAEGAEIQFFYELDKFGVLNDPVRVSIKLGGLFFTNQELKLTIIELDEVPSNVIIPQLTTRPVHPEDRVNIIHHPGGQPKKISMHNNIVAFANTRTLRYFTETRAGSSGAPVFNESFQVVGMHHSSRSDLNSDRKLNEGTSMIAVLRTLEADAPEIYSRLKVI